MKRSCILLMTMLMIVLWSNAQVDLTNTGTLRISNSSGILYINGNFTNNSGSAMVNNGHLYVRGNLTNNETSMTVGTGTLYLNGGSAQAVNGSQPFRTFDLVSDNASGMTLNNNLHVSGAHTFTNGIITTSATPNYLVYEAGSSYVGDADNTHVNGWVKKLGNTNFIFPVGNGTVERTVSLSSLSASSEFDVRYLANTPFYNQMQSPVWSVDNLEYWSINKISGGNAIVTLNWNNSKVYFPNWVVPDILVTGYNGSLWTDNGGAGTASGNTLTTGTVSSSSISSFNWFTFGSRTYVLPLTLINFTATRTNNYTQLGWTTDKEANTSHFVVERSDNGVSFYAIDQLAARNSGVREYYLSRDNAPINGTAYYRLRCVNKDGHEKLSQIVSVHESGAGAQLTLIGNPVRDKIVLMADRLLNGAFSYRINTVNGQLMQQGQLTIQSGGQYELPLKTGFSAGIYLLEVGNGTQSFRYRIIVQ